MMMGPACNRQQVNLKDAPLRLGEVLTDLRMLAERNEQMKKERKEKRI
jgi:hypothetical protein